MAQLIFQQANVHPVLKHVFGLLAGITHRTTITHVMVLIYR